MYQQGFYSTEETLKHHAYILMCQLMSFNELSRLEYYYHSDDAINQLLGVGDAEMNKNIMSLAALSRANDDARDGLKIHATQNPEGVGTLISNGAETVLTAREACNKLIHSKISKLEYVITEKHPLYANAYELNGIKDDQSYNLPFINVDGQTPNGKPYSAKINMVQWIIAVANFGA